MLLNDDRATTGIVQASSKCLMQSVVQLSPRVAIVGTTDSKQELIQPTVCTTENDVQHVAGK